MLSRSKTSIYWIILIAALTGYAAAADRLEIEVRSNILNIRETASTKSPIIEALKKSDRLSVTTTNQSDWIRLDDGRGFISIHYVNILSRTPVIKSPAESAEQAPEETAKITTLTAQTLCQADTANTQLQLTAQSKTCRKNMQTLGYEGCELLFNITLNSSCSEHSQLEIQCQANVISTPRGSADKIKTELSISSLVSLTETTATSQLLRWSPEKSKTPITRVTLSNAGCFLRNPFPSVNARVY
ncbi:MAG: SH3 domain-containing protein [Amphritea sp.]